MEIKKWASLDYVQIILMVKFENSITANKIEISNFLIVSVLWNRINWKFIKFNRLTFVPQVKLLIFFKKKMLIISQKIFCRKSDYVNYSIFYWVHTIEPEISENRVEEAFKIFNNVQSSKNKKYSNVKSFTQEITSWYREVHFISWNIFKQCNSS